MWRREQRTTESSIIDLVLTQMLGEGEKFVGNPLSCRTIERMDAMMEAKRSVGKPNIQTSNRTMLSH